MYRIGEFSKLSKTTVKALRYYDEVGLLKPEFTDPFTGYRFYTPRQLAALHRISAFRQIGLSIDEITLILSGADETDILRGRRREVEDELSRGAEQLSRIDFILSGNMEESMMNYRAIIKEIPECVVYSAKKTVSDCGQYPALISETEQRVAEKYPRLKRAVPEYRFTVCLDGEFKEKNAAVAFCGAVEKVMPDFDGIVFEKLAAVTAVSVIHSGDYSSLAAAYAYAFGWIDENDYAVSGAPREHYLSEEKSPDGQLIELQIPVAKKYSAETRERWGDTEAFDDSEKRTAQRSRRENVGLNEAADEIFGRFALLREGDPAGEAAQALADEWRRFICDNYYDCGKEIFAGLGEMYVADERFMKNIDRHGEGTAEFMSRAIKEYCK